MTEQEALIKAKDIYRKEELFIILSKTRADLALGMSIPFVGQLDDKKIIFIFDEYKKAQNFVIANHMIIEDDIYPIARITNSLKGINLKSIMDIAISLGIYHMEYNSMTGDVFGVAIPWFMQANSLEHESVSMIISEEKFKEIQAGKGIDMSFNPMKIIGFKDSFEISKDREKEILKLVFDAGETVGDYKNTYNKLALIECLLLLDYVTTKFIPTAMHDNKMQDVEYFKTVEPILQEVVWNKVIKEKNLFTAIDPATNYTLIRNESVYVFITDKYEKNGKYKYEKIESGVEGIKTLLRETNAERLVITDGPRYLGIIPREKALELL